MKQRLPFLVVYKDEYIVAVNKAVGIAMTADRWDDSRERLDRLVEVFLTGPEETAGEKPPQRLFTVHRIDRDTSGLVVFARDEETHRRLSGAFEERLVKKRYLAAVYGRPVWPETVCDLPLVPDGNKQHHTIVDKYRGKKSLTRFRFLGSAGNYTLLEALPETGRTHQIRVHLASLGHPVVCDPLYGRGSPKPVYLSDFKRNWRGDPLNEKPLLSRLGLHAAELQLPSGDPEGTSLVLHAPLPRDLAALIKQMEKQAGESFHAGF